MERVQKRQLTFCKRRRSLFRKAQSLPCCATPSVEMILERYAKIIGKTRRNNSHNLHIDNGVGGECNASLENLESLDKGILNELEEKLHRCLCHVREKKNRKILELMEELYPKVQQAEANCVATTELDTIGLGTGKAQNKLSENRKILELMEELYPKVQQIEANIVATTEFDTIGFGVGKTQNKLSENRKILELMEELYPKVQQTEANTVATTESDTIRLGIDKAQNKLSENRKILELMEELYPKVQQVEANTVTTVELDTNGLARKAQNKLSEANVSTSTSEQHQP